MPAAAAAALFAAPFAAARGGGGAPIGRNGTEIAPGVWMPAR
eukprot:gene9581-19730_t